MNERESLLRAVCENPDDDTPRLVFADWLQENGDESDQARAEFIRLGHKRSELLTRFSEAKVEDLPWRELARSLESRMGELWAAQGPKWLTELPTLDGITWGAKSTPWWTGFAGGVQAETVAHCLASASQIVAAAPVYSLTLCDARGLNRLIGTALLNQLRLLRIEGTDGDGAEDLLAARLSDRLRMVISGEMSSPTADRLRLKFGERITLYV